MTSYEKTIETLCRLLAVVRPDPMGAKLSAKIAACTPAPDPEPPFMRFRARVSLIEERFSARDTPCPDNGWYLHLAGSHEALFCGCERPPVEQGETIEVVFRKLKVQPRVS